MTEIQKQTQLLPFKVTSIEKRADRVPWGIEKVEAPCIWEEKEKGEGVVVAVLDTGIDTEHPDLKDRIIGGKNFTDEHGEDDITDRNGHGTHVSGIICASQEGSGVVGVAPKAKVLVVKVLNGNGSGTYDWIIEGIRYATKWRGNNGEKVRIINMSLGGNVHDPDLHDAIKEATLKEIAVVVASGNEGDGNEETEELSYPSVYNEVIEVAASDQFDALAEFSNNNIEVDVIAPGVEILSTYKGGAYATLSGTSMATPHVSGALCLLINLGEKHFKRALTECEIYAHLVKHLVPLGYRASSEGHGLVRLNYSRTLRSMVNYIHKHFCM